MSSKRTELESAITQIYSTFERYEIESLRGCPHCTSSREGDYLASRELEALTPDELERYARKAITTWGSVDDFKHFLPRILQISAHPHQHFWVDVEIVFGKLGYAQFETWT